jgi:tetratricopeptide (TPR) repeat protein
MNKKQNIFLVLLSIVTMYSLSFADGIYLKSGKTIEGEIIERSEDIIKVRVKGRLFERILTYSLDDVGMVYTSPAPQKQDSDKAIYSLQTLITALITYNAVQSQYPENLNDLFSASPPYIEDKKLAKGGDGYAFKYSAITNSEGIRSRFTLVAIPQEPKASTHAAYFVDDTGIIRVGTSTDAPPFGQHGGGGKLEFLETESPLAKATNEEIKSNLETFKELFLNGFTDDELKEAIRIGEYLLQNQPQDNQIRRKVAFLYFVKGDYNKALEYYDTVLESYPKKDRLYEKLKFDFTKSSEIKIMLLELAAIYNDKREFDKMIDYYKQYLRADMPETSDYYKENIAKLSKVPDARVEVLTWLRLRGEGFFVSKTTIRSLEELLEDYPDNSEALYQLGVSNFVIASRLKDKSIDGLDRYIVDSEKFLTKALEFSPQDKYRDIFLSLGRLYKLRGDYDTAIEKYNEALKYRPTKGIFLADINIQIELLDAYKEGRMFDEAVAEAERLLNIHKGSFTSIEQVESKLAEIYEAKGDYRKAIGIYETLSNESSSNAEKEYYKKKILILEEKAQQLE